MPSGLRKTGPGNGGVHRRRRNCAGLVLDYLNEQLLAREARALGLDDNDVIVRRRLAQKLTFLIDDTMRRATPSENELQQFYEAHAAAISKRCAHFVLPCLFQPRAPRRRPVGCKGSVEGAARGRRYAAAGRAGRSPVDRERIPRRDRADRVGRFRRRLCPRGVRARAGRLERPDRIGIRPAPGPRFDIAARTAAPAFGNARTGAGGVEGGAGETGEGHLPRRAAQEIRHRRRRGGEGPDRAAGGRQEPSP